MHSRVEANRKTGQRGKASRPGLTTAALTAALLASTALPSLAAIDQGVSLAVAPGIAPELTPHAPGEGQRIAAPEDRTVEHILPDGTTLTLSPGAALAVTTYRYDPGTRSGELALELGPGLFRIAGGAINNASPIALSAGGGAQACQMTLANGTAVVEVGAGGATRAYLLFGERLTISSGGATGTLVRPGFQLSSSCQGDAPEESILSETQLSADLVQLNPGLLAALAPGAGNDQDEKSDRTATIEDERSDSTPSSGGGGRQITAALGPGQDYGPGPGLGASNVSERPNTQSNVSAVLLAQDRAVLGAAVDDELTPLLRADPRNPGLTTNNAFRSGQLFAQSIEVSPPGRVPTKANFDPATGEFTADGTTTDTLQYIVIDDTIGGPRLALDALGDHTGQFEAPLIIRAPFAADGEVGVLLVNTVQTVGSTDDFGAIFPGTNQVMLLQSGFSRVPSSDAGDQFNRGSASRTPDNFLALQVRPLRATRTFRDQLREETVVVDGHVQNATEFLSAVDLFPDDPAEAQMLADALAEVLLAPTSPGTLVVVDDLPVTLDAEERVRVMARVNFALAGKIDPERTEHFFFAAGDVDGSFDLDGAGPLPPQRDLEFTVDEFFISAGFEGFEQRGGVGEPTVPDASRAFLRRETGFDDPATPKNEGIDLIQTGVLIVNRAPTNSSVVIPREGDFDARSQTAILHADLGVDGEGTDQRSTISITVGHVQYGVNVRHPYRAPGLDEQENIIAHNVNDPGNEVVVSAHTFGSSRDNTEQTATGRAPASTFFTSKLFNTAAGGGNPALNTGVDADGDGALDPRTGRVGYLVLENFDPGAFTGFHANRTSSGVRTGGLEDPLDPLNAPNPEQQYAVLRLGTAVGSLKQAPDANLPDPNVVNTRTSRPLEGFAAGLGEYQDRGAISVVLVDAGIPTPMLKPLEPNLQVTTSAETNKVSAQLQLTGLQATEVKLGADQAGLSAFVDDDTFGARTPAGDKARGEYAMVTGLSLTTPTSNPAVRALPGLGEVPVLKHTQWGFFLGERLAKFNGRDVREHVHLGAWAAGEQLRDDALGGWAGTASYEGVAVGNVFRGRVARGGVSDGNLSTVVGSYRNRWDFGARSGSVDMSFDDRRYTGRTQLERGSARFVGDLQAAGRSGRLDGTFVGKVTDFSDRSGRGPTGLAGQFSIQETGGRDIYRATGVVAADRKGK